MLGLIIELTNKCNLNCKWCGVRKGNDSLGYEKVVSIIDKNNPRFVEFTGGEPLLRKDLFRIIDYCKSKGIFVSLNTNGTLVDDNVAGKLNADIVRVSVDGIKEVNDSIRGKGSFEKAVKGIKALRKKGKKVVVSTAVGRVNKDQPRKIIDHFYPDVRNFMIGRVLPTPELGYSQCINGLEAFRTWLRLLPYRLNPFLRLNFAMQFGALFYFSFVPPEVLSNGDIIPCCIDRGKKVKDLKTKPCLLLFSSCEKCVAKYFKKEPK